MTKLLLIPNKNTLNLNADALLLGIKNLSVNMPTYFTLDEIKDILNKTNKEIFISLNKNMHSKDLDLLTNTLTELNNLNIKGVLFYDIGVLNIVNKLKLNIDLIWGQEHLTTNYQTINFWHKRGTRYTLISPEISLNEITKIKNNTESKLIVPVIGYIPMFVSKRHLVQNYLKQFDLKDDSKINYIEKEGKIYPIIDEEVTTVYTNAYLNITKEITKLKEINIEYLLINSLLIEDENMEKIINILNNTPEQTKEKIDKILNNNTDTFFLNKETIYKVK